MPKYNDPKVPFVPDRTVLPIHEPTYPPCKDMFADDNPTPPPPRFTVKAPEKAPNVLIFLIDDMGYGASSAFGGPIPMPTSERLAKTGLRFNRFHTTAVCAPTRAALLSGYNHHSVNMANITELGTAYPGNLSTRPKTVTPMAQVLRLNGYSTAQFGKCHETPAWETTASGPFDHWPTFSGFDKFYGFLAGETNQYHPALNDGVTLIEPPKKENYHLTEDLADQCILWMKTQKAMTPDKPFFVYFAPGATHAPHHAPEKYRDMFKGQFDDGWDAMRQKTLEKMIKMGVVPPNTKLADKPKDIADWDTLPDVEKKLYARQMEIYAGFARHTDDQIGRVVDTVEEMKLLENTIILYIMGDNGASGEGRMTGVVNENAAINDAPEPLEFILENQHLLGTDMAYNHYAAGWAVALDAPYKWVKTVASNFGGNRNAMIFHYPAKYKGKGEVLNQFHHVIDVAPTIYELCGIPIPKMVDGVEQRPMEGVSMKYALDNHKAKGQRQTQYFCIFSNFGVYHDGWFAGVVDKLSWEVKPLYEKTKDAPWELYNLEEDFSCANDVAKKYPEKLEELKKIFYEEGLKHNVFPIEGRGGILLNADVAGRPTIFGDRREVTLYEGVIGIKEHAFLEMKNRSFTITAEVEVGPGHTDGVIFAQGGRFAGYSLYIKDGIPCFCYNWLGRERYYTKATKPLVDERNQIRLEFKYDGGGFGKGGNTTLYVNNKKAAEGRIDRTVGNQFSFDESADVGMQRATPVTEEYTVENSKFKGRIYSVNIKTEPPNVK
ncbi:arylsulfatase [Methanolapillus millepedarum]|uniref:Sulfatase N-terminal domain-containing protein n=1 Tax=Methanolapillus millepedarum TaxID=3028296 RepID=A0AA96V2B8_9EURY|nr:hypothetical protein MsAc7_07550 [Methanosarcinaceae archaeon Ac7]